MARSLIINIIMIFSLVLCGSVSAGTIHVPGDYGTIQAGVDAAFDGDTVLVAKGIYTGDGNRDISWSGKNIVVKSSDGADSTVIDCNGFSPYYRCGFYLEDTNITSASVIEGFTITRGFTLQGGAIYLNNASPIVRKNIIQGNVSVGSGGGTLLLQQQCNY